MPKQIKQKSAIMGLAVGIVFLALYFLIPSYFPTEYVGKDIATPTVTLADVLPAEPQFRVTHIKTPDSVRAIYMTSWVAGTPSIRKRLVKLIEDTEINSIIIDIKDDTGKISFKVTDPFLKEIGAQEIRIRDVKEFIGDLHDSGVYVIGRISAFQDPHLTKVRPGYAVLRESNGEVWTDHKGISWVDPGNREVWRYLVAIGKESYNVGFDELNYDYVRFPSDGDMHDIKYPISDATINADPDLGKAKVLRDFFAYIRRHLDSTGAVISADLFGMTTSNNDDLNIGQILEYVLPHVDFVAPMVYPSHYPTNFIGLANPAEEPYKVIKFSMDEAKKKADALDLKLASSTPGYSVHSFGKIRPWLQDFDLGANYDAEKVRAQIQAVYDSGLDSWMLWNASNRYTEDALLDNSDIETVE
ncbi:hypothetical protein COB55_00285 [Candidatus Wolfebacteria bacterium]|nr:MAG: hypothetical protein COB55_00285 [Candidatus Wolfebacteria bacterium]